MSGKQVPTLLIGTIVIGLALTGTVIMLHPESSPCLEAALDTAAWIESAGLPGRDDGSDVGGGDGRDRGDGGHSRLGTDAGAGTRWALPTDLYSGSAGVVLFFIELAGATGDPAWLEKARAGADSLVASIPEAIDKPAEAGLYTGAAGTGFVLLETYRATGDEAYRRAARRCVDLLHRSARTAGAGVDWGGATDIISGSAGIGLFLLRAADDLDHPPARDLAWQAGWRLKQIGIPEEGGGLKWRMNPDYPRLMPNFSHGTAGIAYFLARLHEETGDETFLEGALAGARYLRSVTSASGLVFHHEPGGEDLFYLGWCHGPPGTGRLYYQLWKETGDEEWSRALHECAAAVIRTGIPRKRPPGFWNNFGQCCGSAGVADFFLELHIATGHAGYLAFARRLTADLLFRATRDGTGVRWVHAEHRVRPDEVEAQVGHMQGAAGIGLWLLKMDAFMERTEPGVRFPDSPFRGSVD